MEPSDKIIELFKKFPQWKEELESIRALFLKTPLTETIKWGAPCYTFNGKNVVGMVAFKNHLGIWFHQGVFLKDPQSILINAQEGKTKALRQWRINLDSTLDYDILNAYTLEAIENCKAGKEIQPVPKPSIQSLLLATKLSKDPVLKADFKKLTPGRQKEYMSFIAEAKREATKHSRLKKIIPMIKNGIGLNDN